VHEYEHITLVRALLAGGSAVEAAGLLDRLLKAAEYAGRIGSLIRWSGLAAVVAGVIFAGIQPIHPADVVESVTTTAWAIITPLETAMCLLFWAGITGIYARQVEKAGWLGLAGFLLLIVSWWLQTAFVFAEAFILPPLAATAPEFVDAALGISYGHTGGVNLGALPTLLLDRCRHHLYARRLAVWHRDAARWHPAARARRCACYRRHADPSGGTPPARAAALRGHTGGVGSGVAGLRALVRAAHFGHATRDRNSAGYDAPGLANGPKCSSRVSGRALVHFFAPIEPTRG
jgi:hypothetical protein